MKSKQIQKEIDEEYKDYKLWQQQLHQETTLVKENEYLREKVEQIRLSRTNLY